MPKEWASERSSRPSVEPCQKPTHAWGDEWARSLWDDFLHRADVEWKGATVLDFGCHGGSLSVFLAEQTGAEAVHGVEERPVWESLDDGWRPEASPMSACTRGICWSSPPSRACGST